MKISSKTHYGVQVLYLLASSSDTILSAKQIESNTGVTIKYLEKVLKILVSIGVIKSTRGINGGYELNKSANQISMGDVIRALEQDDLVIIDCVCETNCNCPSNWLWKKLYEQINITLDGITLQDMIDNNKNKGCKNEGNLLRPCGNN